MANKKVTIFTFYAALINKKNIGIQKVMCNFAPLDEVYSCKLGFWQTNPFHVFVCLKELDTRKLA